MGNKLCILEQSLKLVAYMKEHRPEEFAAIMKNYRTEKDFLWELRHYAAKAQKLYEESYNNVN